MAALQPSQLVAIESPLTWANSPWLLELAGQNDWASSPWHGPRMPDLPHIARSVLPPWRGMSSWNSYL